MLWQGDLGYSLINKTNIAKDMSVKIPNTINLVLPSYVTAFMLAILLGLLAGYKKDGWIDKIINGAASVGLAVPTFWVALLVIYKFGCDLKWFPIVGMHTIGDESFGDFIMHFIMPYSVLIIGFLPDLVRYVRSSTITQLSEDYVLVQKAFGSNKMEILFKHVSRNVLLPLITKLGMSLPMLVTGAVITETMPDYDVASGTQVEVTVYGKILNDNYMHILYDHPELDLHTVFLLDRVQKGLPMQKEDVDKLRSLKLVEGRITSLYLSASAAKNISDGAGYIKNKGFDDKYYKDLIVEYLKQYEKAKKSEIRELLWDKLPDVLSDKQKENKIRNLLYSLKQKKIIETDSTNQQKSNWVLRK